VDVVDAIADPVRREILDRLRGGPQPAGAIAGWFTISRPAVSRHLRVLREAGLVADDLVGRRRVYRLDAAPLAELDAWLAPFRLDGQHRLGSALDALATEVHRTKRERRRPTKTTRPQERTA
jgi:DNA-binding transcriptional ArsR family regulator